jgi:hypothetical protein
MGEVFVNQYRNHWNGRSGKALSWVTA